MVGLTRAARTIVLKAIRFIILNEQEIVEIENIG